MTPLLIAILGALPAHSAPDDPAPGASTATEATEKAKLLFQNGAALYHEGLYEAALRAFEEAMELSGNKKLLVNIASTRERLGDLQGCHEALLEYRIYADPSEMGALISRIRALERRIALREQEEAEAAEAAEAAAPAPAPMPVPPQPAVTRRPNPAKWVLFGAGSAVAAGFGATAGVTYAAGRRLASTGQQDGYGSARTINNVSIPLAGVGAGVALIGLALPAKKTVTVAPAPGGVTLRGDF